MKEYLMVKDMSELTPRQRSQILALKRLADDRIDTSDIPENLNWSNVTRGAFYRPGKRQVGREIASTTDTTEKGLENLICASMTDSRRQPPSGDRRGVVERPASYGAGWTQGRSAGLRP